MIYNDDRPERIWGMIYLSVIVLFLGYETLNLFISNADMIIATRVLAAGFYSVVLYVFAPDALVSVRRTTPERGDFLIVGIWLSFLSHLFQTTYAIVYRLADAPKWLLNAEIVAPIVMLSAVAAVLHVSAPGAVNGVVPRRNRIALGIGVGASVLMLGAILITRPDLGPMINLAQPWIGDWFKGGTAYGRLAVTASTAQLP